MIFKSVLFFLGLFTRVGYACTDFVLINDNKNVVVARSMEFAQNLESEILVYPKGLKNVSILDNNQKGFSWTSKYAVIGMTCFGEEKFISDGMNDQGLSFGLLFFPGAKYPPLRSDNKSNMINFDDVGCWILGSFVTVEEVKGALQKIQIWFHEIPQLKEIPPLHLSIHDASGKSLVVEFINGKMEISDNPIGVLTNAPKFEWMETNLRNYINLTAVNSKTVQIDGTVLDPTGQGSGLLGIPGDWTPPSRFVRIALFKNSVQKTKTPVENRNLAFHLLNTVDIPYGVIRDSGGKDFDFTQWIVVKDLSDKKFFYRTYKDLSIKSIDFIKVAQNLKQPKKFPMIGTY